MDDKILPCPVECDISIENTEKGIVKTYYEKQIGKTLYRITNVYLGKIDFQKAIEDYTVRKILAAINDPKSIE